MTHPIEAAPLADTVQALCFAGRPGAAGLLQAVAGVIVLNATPDRELRDLGQALALGGIELIRAIPEGEP